jgi:hypothetical protein
MSVTITSPTSGQQIKGGKLPFVTVFAAALPTKVETTARFTLDGAPIGRENGLVKVPIKQVAVPGGEAFLYALVVTITTEGQHVLRVENLDTTNPVVLLRGFAEVSFTFAVDPTVSTIRGSELIAEHLRAADPHGQYLTPTEADNLYRSLAAEIPESAIDSTVARDTEVDAKDVALKAEFQTADATIKAEADAAYRKIGTQISDLDVSNLIARDAEFQAADAAHLTAVDPHPLYLTAVEADAAYRKISTPLIPSDIPASQATDAEVTTEIEKHAAKEDPHPAFWTRILNTFMRLVGGQQILKNNPLIAYTSFLSSNSHIELATNDGSNPIIGFHRGGRSGTALYHAGYGKDSIKIINADGYDAELLHKVNHLDLPDVHGTRTAFLSLVIPNTINGSSSLPLGAINPDKIVKIDGMVVVTSGTNKALVPAGGTGVAGNSYFLSVSNGFIICRTTSDSASILGQTVKVTIWYQP